MAAISKTLREAARRLGPFGFLKLLARKLVKRQRYKLMLREVPKVKTIATLRETPAPTQIRIPEHKRHVIVEAADRMLRDENTFFTFAYSLRDVEHPWDYDPLEKKHWPRRHYTEQKLHGDDTPHDVKIVWEINRFVDLPTLAEAAYLTRDERYAKEIEWRMLSWAEENPFAHSINWASALEIGIRIISWSASLRLLQLAGFSVHDNERIRRSIYVQLRYLSADLSIDKVVPTNHLIGEAAGLFVGASFWDYPTAALDRTIARRILETEILRQTYSDGATREATSWYHQFVTGLFDLVDRVARGSGEPMSPEFEGRLQLMKQYLQSLIYNGSVVRYGDADEGLPIALRGDPGPWLALVFGEGDENLATKTFFDSAKHAALRVNDSYLFVRGGEFGMGGAGFSSHAHDDFLSPILFLDGLPVLADPGTFVYNGLPEHRRKYRGAEAHNGLVLGEKTGAEQRMNFGWHAVRPPAMLRLGESTADNATVVGCYAEWPSHERRFQLESRTMSVRDVFAESLPETAHWRFHLDPRWKPVHQSEPEYHFEDSKGNRLLVRLTGKYESLKLEHYDYSPSYRVKVQAFALELSAPVMKGEFAASFSLAD